MHRPTMRLTASTIAVGAALFVAASASAQSRQITRPNTSTAAGQTDVVLGGVTFSNKGLIGAGRLDANTRDFRNETLGSFSGMAINLSTWRRNADGSYASSIVTLPDRGPFDGAIDYRDRVHTHDISFRPLSVTNTATLPQTVASQNQLTITPTGGFTLKDANGVEMTGRDPGASTVTRGGIVYPLATAGTAAGRIALDPEAIAFRPDGSFYISDEYAAGIYLFNAAGTQIGAIQTVPALLPRVNGTINFDSTVTQTAGVTGRRGNQGLEAMTITPDNKKLITILQSATVQDTNGTAQQTRNNTRILVYDISNNATPTNPIGHYVLQLPVFTNSGNGAAVDRTAAQSEMLALNDNQFLVLSRDGLGRGVAAPAGLTMPVFKSILLVDTTGATNLAGTQYETGITPLATNGALLPSIVPVQQVEIVNMLNPTQLARVGMNTNFGPSNATSLSEKIEAMALAPVLEESAPQDFFLFVGNDNDFRGTQTRFDGQANGAITSVSTPDGGNNDSVMLVYRLTLPTYVDPQALQAMNLTAPDVLYGTRMALSGLGVSTTQPAMRFLNAGRGWAQGGSDRAQLWIDLDWNKIGAGASPLTGLDVDTIGTTIGVDLPVGQGIRIGITGGYRKMDGALAYGAAIEARAWTVGAYAAIETQAGFYGQVAAARLGNVEFDTIGRFSAYDQQANGRTTGKGWAASGEIGFRIPFGKASLTPFAAVDYTDVDLGAYTETGASVSNLTYADRSFRKTIASVGGELGIQLGALRPAIRAGYSFEKERGDDSTIVRLANAQHSMGSATMALADTERDTAFAEARLAMRQGGLSAYVAGRGRWGRGEDDARVSVGVGFAF